MHTVTQSRCPAAIYSLSCMNSRKTSHHPITARLWTACHVFLTKSLNQSGRRWKPEALPSYKVLIVAWLSPLAAIVPANAKPKGHHTTTHQVAMPAASSSSNGAVHSIPLSRKKFWITLQLSQYHLYKYNCESVMLKGGAQAVLRRCSPGVQAVFSCTA